MASLLVTVFVIQVVCHLILTVGSKPINDLLWQIYCRLPLAASRDIHEQIRLRREVVRLKREMKAISAQDEFSKWAKIRRQHDKTMEEHDRQAAVVASSRASFDSTATAIRWTCTSGLRLMLQFWHAKTPVFTYPRGWFPWQVEWLLGFPRCPYGGVSVNVWSTACATVVALVWDFAVYMISAMQGVRSEHQKSRQKVPLAAAGANAAHTQ